MYLLCLLLSTVPIARDDCVTMICAQCLTHMEGLGDGGH